MLFRCSAMQARFAYTLLFNLKTKEETLTTVELPYLVQEKNLGFSRNRDNSLRKKRTEFGVLCCVCFRADPGGAYYSFNEY